MITNWIDGTIVIAEVIDRFNIETTDWIPRCGYWIEKGLADLKVLPTSEELCKTVNATNYIVDIPYGAKSVTAVEIQGIRIVNSNQIKRGSMGITALTYTYLRTGKIRLESEAPNIADTEVTIYYKGFPTTFNTTLYLDIPLVPDKSIVIEALALYIFKMILGRGYEHPVFSISGNDPYTNVSVMYSGMDGTGGLRKRAMIEAKTMNKDERELVSRKIRTFLTNEEYYNHSFDGKQNILP